MSVETDLASLNTHLTDAAAKLRATIVSITPSDTAAIQNALAAYSEVTAAMTDAANLQADLVPPPPPPPPPSGKVLLGVYCGAGDVADVKSWGTDYNKTISLISTYCDGTSPSSLSNGDWNLAKYNNCGLRLVIGVNVYFGQGNQLSDLAKGAQGGYNSAYQQLAQNLIANGQGNAILRIGWEPDVNIFSSGDITSAQNYAKFFQQIRTTMQAVPGAQFAYSWYMGQSFDDATVNASYPGDAFVDCIEDDPYDQSWTGACGLAYDGSNWNPTQSQCVWTNDLLPRMQRHAAFAKAHNKPLAWGEWGVINRSDGHGGGDDPTFMANMVNWVNANNFMWISYFNFNSGGNSVLGDYPNAGAQLKSMSLG